MSHQQVPTTETKPVAEWMQMTKEWAQDIC